MPLQGKAKRLYQKKYMRRRRAALRAAGRSDSARAPANFLVTVQAAIDQAEATKPDPKRCSFCGRAASRERIIVLIESDDGKCRARICESCHAGAGDVLAAQRAAWRGGT